MRCFVWTSSGRWYEMDTFAHLEPLSEGNEFHWNQHLLWFQILFSIYALSRLNPELFNWASYQANPIWHTEEWLYLQICKLKDLLSDIAGTQTVEVHFICLFILLQQHRSLGISECEPVSITLQNHLWVQNVCPYYSIKK